MRAALRAFVGTGTPLTVKMLANASGVPDKTIVCAMAEVGSEHWRPMPFDRLLSIAAVLGAEFTAACLQPARQGAFDLPIAANLDPAALMIEVTTNAQAIVSLAADNDICAADLVKMDPLALAHIDLGVRIKAACWQQAA
ncbi:hypothetical protein [Sphingomonas sp. BK235]|uniref:hypothetical protein n=1 Tax=Sphingomonas sp. BK235 TaxID=2512131 RepID=UPI00104EE57F|nr:hypothetical protein [Sphingomonas sp. BK235]TCP30720.1 hypothetical protein EV292_11277 [Sphingomonas sp. BK235]